MKILLFTLFAICLLVSCSPSKCSIYDTFYSISILDWNGNKVPEKGVVYITGKKKFFPTRRFSSDINDGKKRV